MHTAFRMIMLQFSFSNAEICPRYIPMVDGEATRQDARDRKQVPRERLGMQIIQPTEKVAVAPFIVDLNKGGWVLARASRQRRMHLEKSEFYYTTRFLFFHGEKARIDHTIVGMQDLMLSALLRFSSESYWRVRGYNNPYVEENGMPTRERMLSINLEVPMLRVDRHGDWILGIGSNARVAQPDYVLTPRGDTIVLVRNVTR